MLDFPKNYFDEEVRSGFKISHMMKCTWAAQLKVLLVIEEICKRHNLQYYAIFGTLLGAVRHKGFIPWDDDMDIAMKREDYIRFFIYAKEELPAGYRILSPYTNKEWEESFSRIVNSNKIDISEERLNEFYGCPFVVGIDIFPLDNLPQNPQIRKVQNNMLEIAQGCTQIMTYLTHCGEKDLEVDDTYKENLAEGIKILSDFTGIKREQGISLSTWLLRMFDAVCMIGNSENSDVVGAFQIQCGNSLTEEITMDSLSQTIKMDFETIALDVPIGYEEVLKNVYGRYRELKFIPSHEYPFYKKQIPVMQGKNIWDEKELNEIMNQNFDDYQLDRYGDADAEPPKEWNAQIDMARQKGKKIILFGTSLIDFMMQEEEYVNRLSRVLEKMVKNKEGILIWWRPDKVAGYIYFYRHPELEKKYNECIQYFKDNDLGILDETDELVRALKRTDIYWGDETIAYNRYLLTGKPCWLREETDLRFVLD